MLQQGKGKIRYYAGFSVLALVLMLLLTIVPVAAEGNGADTSITHDKAQACVTFDDGTKFCYSFDALTVQTQTPSGNASYTAHYRFTYSLTDPYNIVFETSTQSYHTHSLYKDSIQHEFMLHSYLSGSYYNSGCIYTVDTHMVSTPHGYEFQFDRSFLTCS